MPAEILPGSRTFDVAVAADLPVHRVAEHAGLGTAANLRRRLRDATGAAPDAYRRTFAQPVLR